MKYPVRTDAIKGQEIAVSEKVTELVDKSESGQLYVSFDLDYQGLPPS